MSQPDHRFRLLAPLGDGAMGEVWKAEELRTGKHRALKFVPVHLLRDSAALARLEAEADRLAELHHPSIVKTLGWRRGPEGYPFIVMACLEGETLRSRLLREQRLDLETALAVLRPVAAALDHAHGQGVIHRDVKPENIMLGPDGRVTLVDFGLSDPLKRSSGLGQASDKDASGTVGYMPPEAFVGGGGAHHRKRDIYALAVVLYECLSGELPFDGPLLAIRPAELFPGCPEGLRDGAWAALKQGLHRERTARPGTAVALLESVAAGQRAVVKPRLPAVVSVHGWGAGQVRQLQRETAAGLGSEMAFQDRLRDGSVGPEMMVIPAGTFLIGSPEDEAGRDSDERQHEVTIARPFALASCALAFGWYDRFCAATGREKPDDRGWGRGERPAINVSWWDAVAFCEWLSVETGQVYRLPTEAEWEYACRAGTVTAFWWGNDIHPGLANYDGNHTYRNGRKGEYRRKTVPVRSFEANPWGLYQMHGNVWEWTGSAWDASYGGTEQDYLSKNNANYQEAPRVLRGGSWDDFPRRVRSANRGRNAPGGRDNGRGFRLARSF